VPDSLAPKLAEQAEKSGLADPVLALAAALDKALQPAPIDMQTAAILVLAGPPGAGKSTIAAKLAAHAKLAGRKAVLVATDLSGAGALQRLKTFAAHLDTDCVTADDAEIFATIAAQARRDGSLLIADTAGIDARAPESWRTLLAFTENAGTELLGVLPATMDAEEIGDTARALVQLGATRAIATQCDLVRRQGALTALAFSTLHIAHVTASAYLASGLETLTPLRLARALIEGADLPSALRNEMA
jgi:flagellar biosynthesis protein FlhF